MIQIGLLATSSVVPKVEFDLGLDVLHQAGFGVTVHPEVFGEHYFYPAPDAVRAKAFLEFAFDPTLSVIWCARGGYGATHLLPFLEKATRKKKPPRKLLIGYSDATALHVFAKERWGWETIHGPMPSLRTFSFLKPQEAETLFQWVRASAEPSRKARPKKLLPASFNLQWIYQPKGMKKIEAPLCGGNLFVWNSLLGTPYAGNARGKILFLEEILENVPRINRMLHHLEQAGGLKGVKAIVLGDFKDCNDSVPNCLKVAPSSTLTPAEREGYLRNPPASALGPLRQAIPAETALDFVFHSLGERTGIPILKGIPAGHGSDHFPFFLGKKYSLSPKGVFSTGF